MNGRAYDYQLGRFLSVDPIIQAPGNSQSLNPYNYIMNNPLAGTDPSGYVPILIPILAKAIGYGLSVWGAYEGGKTVGDTIYQVSTGEKEAGEAIKEASVDLAVEAGITITGTRVIRLAERVVPETVQNKVKDAAEELLDRKSSNGTDSAVQSSNGDTTKIGSSTERGDGLARQGDHDGSSAGARSSESVEDVPVSGETRYTAAGRRAHQQEPLPPGFERDVRIPGTRMRMDGYNPDTKEILELKPDNARQIRRGERQLERYCAACDDSDLGAGHTALPVQTYDPSDYVN